MENKTGLSHIMLLEFKEQCGPYTKEMVALYNSERMTEAEAFRFISAGEYNDNVLVMPKRQWCALFKNSVEQSAVAF